jgi:hypothetical protein
MPFLDRLLELRPFAYHTCGGVNFASIQRSRSLRSAHSLLSGTPHANLLAGRRSASQVVQTAQGPIEIRDHGPLRPGSIALQDGITLAGFVNELNVRVFLWAGVSDGIGRVGQAHFDHYAGVGVVRVIRVPLLSLIRANTNQDLQVTYCNSGSARHQAGKPVERGRATFQPIARATGQASKVKELTYIGVARRPDDTAWSHSPTGQWQPL